MCTSAEVTNEWSYASAAPMYLYGGHVGGLRLWGRCTKRAKSQISSVLISLPDF
jgi:hypothetical protein